MHLLVDAVCACGISMLLPCVHPLKVMTVYLTYNGLAFLLQPFIGICLDRHKLTSHAAVVSCMLLVGGGLFSVWPIGGIGLPVVLLGLGNAIFHVHGGIRITTGTGNDMRFLGIFVSTGAVGLTMGSLFPCVETIILLVSILVVLTIMYARKFVGEKVLPETHTSESNVSLWLLALMLVVVFGRSFFGKLQPSGVEQTGAMVWLLGMLAFAGKASGGFVASRFGVWSTLGVSLGLAATCFMLGALQPMFLWGMVLALNLSMPITLHLANKALPGTPGVAFGLLAAMLIPGVLLGMYFNDYPALWLLLYPLVITIVLEFVVLLCLHEKRPKVWFMLVLMNVLTNVPLNIWALHSYPSISTQVLLEMAVMMVEFGLYLVVVHHWRTALKYAVSCNAASYLAGVLINIII